MHYTPHTQTTQFIITLITAIVSYAVIALVAGICGIFYAIPIFLVWATTLALCTVIGAITWTLPSRDFALPVLSALLFALIIATVTVPTVFDGRDQGSLADAAIRLATTHTLVDHTPESDMFFALYGRGQALHFPGYFYAPDGALVTQFPLPYTTFLAGWYGIFGVTGLIIANALLLILTILVLTYASRYFLTQKWSTVFLILLLSSFPLGWFAKYTLSENLAGALLWSAFGLLLMLLRTPSAPPWFALWATVALLTATRIEGIWFALFFLGVCASSATLRTFIRASAWYRLFMPAAITLSIGIVTGLASIPFLTVMLKALFATSPLSSPLHTAGKFLALPSVYMLYGLVIPLLTSIVFTAVVLWRRYKYRTSLFPLLPIALVAPLVVYYMFPNITADHPWMLRRYGFALVNAALLASVIFSAGIPGTGALRRALRIGIPTCIFLAHLPAFIYFLPYAEHRTLATQITTIGQTFTADDLVLVDRMATGNGWAMMNTLLRSTAGTHAAYIFNPEDLPRIDTQAFRHVYLIVANEDAARYHNALPTSMLRPHATYHLTTSHLAPAHITTHPYAFPKKYHGSITGIIYEIIF